jgi:WD40 repeat protein
VASQYDEKIDRIEGEMKNKMGKIDSSLTDLKGRLIIGSSASLEFVVNIERTTLRAIRLRNHIDAKNGDLAENEALLEAQEEACKKIEDLLTAIQKEIDAAYETDEFEMISYLVHETPQMVDIEELKTRLAGRKDEELFNYKTEKAEEARIKTVIGNLKDDVNIASDELDLEEVALMKKSRLDRPFRCVEFCPTNVAGNEVTGTATGGVEWFIAAEGPNIHCIDYHSGEILTVIVGGDKANKDKANARDKEYNLDKDTGNEKDEAVGHTGIVTCLLHDGHLLFSGSIDETIICWDARTKKRITTMVGHEGSIVALAVEDIRLASASADATIRIWDKISGEQLRVVYGHSKSVLSMQMGEMWMLTGSADEDVRVWSIERAGKRSLSVKCKHRLVGHETPVTCVRYGRLEVISGDSLGRIFIWWMETGEVIRKCEVHKGPVKCMQFDSCHIVSGGADSNLCVTDIATGDVMTTLRGHEKGHVLSLAFDSERIISVGADNTLRYWQWGKKSGPLDKFHVLDKGQTLIAVSKIYNVSVAEIMAWNGIIEMRHCYPGMKLIVKKGNPDMPTMAEKIAQEKAYRREGAGGLAGQHSKADAALEKKAGTGLIKALKFDRVKRQANNWDRNSLGNRMFLKEKKDHELFPNSIDIQGNGGNLAGRLRRQKAALTGQQQGQSIESDDPPARFFIHKENEDQWGPVADSLGTAMLNMLMEYSLYAVVAEVKDDLIDKRSVQGRIVAIQRMEAKLAAMAAANAASISEQPDATATALTSAADAKDSVTAVAATDSPSAVVGSAIGGIEVRDQKSRASRRRASKNRAHSAASASDSSTAHSKKHSSGTAEANSVPDVNNTGTALVHADAAIGANMNVIPTADSDTDAEAGAIHSVTDDANDQSSASPPHSNHRRRKDKSKSRGKARSKSRGKSQTRSKRRHERRQSQSPSQSPEASSVNSNVKVNFNVDVEGHTGVIGNETVPINVDESPGSNDDVIRRLVLPPIPGAAERS